MEGGNRSEEKEKGWNAGRVRNVRRRERNERKKGRKWRISNERRREKNERRRDMMEDKEGNEKGK